MIVVVVVVFPLVAMNRTKIISFFSLSKELSKDKLKEEEKTLCLFLQELFNTLHIQIEQFPQQKYHHISFFV